LQHVILLPNLLPRTCRRRVRGIRGIRGNLKMGKYGR